jgi:hypothetical protein
MQTSSPEALCRGYAAEHHGVIPGRAARSLGMTHRMIASAVKSGRWRRHGRDIFILDGASESFRQLAASASARQAVCSHRCAAALYGLDGVKANKIEIVTTRPFKLMGLPHSVIVHRTCHLPDDHISEHEGVALTSVGRTLLDLAGVSGYDVMRRATMSAVDKGLTSPEQLIGQLRCCAQMGRPGSAAFRRFLLEMDWDLDPSDSDLEDLAFSLIVEAGCPRPKRLFKVYDEGLLLGELDLAFPSHRIGVEVDSFAFHGDRSAFVRDRSRLNGFMARSDWRILHFVHDDVRRPRRFLDDLQALLERTEITSEVN